MKDLDLVINKKGFTYKQVFKNETGYIYSQHLGDRLLGFEVFYRKENTQFDCVSFPGDESFGIWAWSVRTFDKAMIYLNNG